MHKLTNLEAQRVIAVLEDAVERIGLLSHIPLKPDLDLLSRIDDLGLKDATKQQWQVEERHRLLERCPYDDGKDTKPESVSSQMTSTIRNLCRNLKKDENISLVKARNLPTSSTLLVHQQCLNSLMQIMFRQLSTTVEEETANSNMMQELTEKEKSAAQEVIALKRTLEMHRTERDQEVSALDRTLTKLRAELHELMQDNKRNWESVSSQMELQIANSEKGHTTSSQLLSEKKLSLKTNIETERQSGRDAEVIKYDENMAALLRQTEEIKEKMTSERDDLLDLEEYFAKVDANQKRQNVEIEVLSIFAQRRNFVKGKLNREVTSIQKIVRGRQLRIFFRQLSNKKSKKGKSGKGKKKK